MTELHYVCRSPYDARELSRPTTDRNKATQELKQLRYQYPAAVLASLCVGFDDDEGGDQQ